MKAKHSVWKSKLAKTMFLTTVVLVAALFMGSAASAALKAVGTGEKNTQNNNDLCKILGLPAGTLNVPNIQPTLSAQKTTMAPHSTYPSVEKKPTAPKNGRGYFLAYDTLNYYTVTFDTDAVLNDMSFVGVSFLAGSDIDENGNWYGIAYYGGLYSIDKDTGVATFIANTIGCNSLVYDTTSQTWYCCSTNTGIDALYTIDITTGVTTEVGAFGQTNTMISLMCDTYGNMYSYDVLFSGDSHLYTIDKSTGVATMGPDMGHTFLYQQEGKFDRNYGDNTLYLAASEYTVSGTFLHYLATCDVSTGTVTIVNMFDNQNTYIDALAIPYILTVYDNDVGVKKIVAPVSGDAGIIAPQVTVKNFGNNEEYFPTEVTISKKVYSTYLTQDFEGSFPPAGWTVQTITGGSWERNDFWSTPRPNMAGTGYCADADVNMQGSAPMITLLTSPSMDLSAAPGAILNVDSYEYVYYYDILLIDVSIDGGNTWNNLYKVGSMYEYGTLHNIQKDMSAYAGNSDVRIRFGYIAEQADMYWEIDNVMVRSYNWNVEYGPTQVYTDLVSMQSTNLTFPDWTPADMGVSEDKTLEYKVDATTLLTGDQNTHNDMKEMMFTLHYGYFHDVAITSIDSPNSGLAQTQPVSVTLANHGQNAETVNVDVQIGKVTNPETIFYEDFSGGVLPPGWGTDHPSNWYVQYSNYAGGVAPELIFNYYPNSVDTFRVYTGPIDTTGFSALQLSFKQATNDFNGDYTLVVQTSTNGVDWTTVYTQAGGPYGPATTTVSLTGGSPTLQVAWALIGDSYNINDWYIDDVEIDSLPISVEYDNSTMVNINPGQTMTVNLPDWTPAGLTLGDINYVVTATATLNGVNTIGTYGFEDYVPGGGTTFPPTGWGVYDNDGNYESWYLCTWGSYYAHTGSVSCYAYDYPSIGAEDNWLVSNQMTVPGDGGAGFSFWAADFYGYGHTVEAWFCPTGNTPTDFMNNGVYLGSAYVYQTLPTWTNEWFSTASIAGQTGWFAIRDTTSTYSYYMFVDDIAFPDGSTQGFEVTPGYFPSWTSYQIVGTDSYNKWDGSSLASSPPYMSPHSGTYMAEYYAWIATAGDEARLQNNNPIDLSATGYSTLQGSFWMYHDNYYSGSGNVQFQVSTDGVNWDTLGTFYRYDASNPGWVQHNVDLSAYASDSTVYFGFLATSDWWGEIAIDDLALNGLGALLDGYPADNMLSKMITLSYVHDAGIAAITQPTAPPMKDVIWDNGPHTLNALSSQDATGSFSSQVADDFQFDKMMDVTQVAFDGLFWNGGSVNPIDINVIFYADDGSGNQPTGAGMTDPTSTALQVELHPGVTGTDNGDGSYNYNIVLNTPFTAEANTKYWFVAQWVGAFPPQWGICVSSTQQLHDAMQGFPQLSPPVPFWTDPGYGDVSFQLMGQEHQVGGTFPPGSYPIAAIVQNYGVTYTESDIPVEATVTSLNNNTVIYDHTGSVAGPLAPGASTTFTFPLEFTLANLTAWDGKYKIEVKTMLPNDDKPSNDKKSITITMAIPDVLPPITNHTITGTFGLNNWYVSNAVITLTAIDPSPPMKSMKSDPKPPSGVNHTYYKLHTGDAYLEYLSPVTVSTDGIYALYYYSIDKAGNAETAKGPFAFKMDKTAPIINLTATKQGMKWNLTADVTDATSGIAKVEFYVDDVLVGNATSAPYFYLYKGNGKVAQAIAYDKAGNSAMSPQVKSLDLNAISQQLSNPNAQGQLSIQQQMLQQK